MTWLCLMVSESAQMSFSVVWISNNSQLPCRFNVSVQLRLSLRRECRDSGVFESRVMWTMPITERERVTGGWRNFCNYRWPDIMIMKSRRLRWVGHAENMEMNKYNTLARQSGGKRQLESPRPWCVWVGVGESASVARRWWEDNIGMNIREVRYEVVDFFLPTQEDPVVDSCGHRF
jgi:hypothetical protein